MRYIQQAFAVPGNVLEQSEKCADEAVFCSTAFANVVDQGDVDLVAGLNMGARAIEAGDIIGRYLPIVTYTARGADRDPMSAAKTLVPFIIAFVKAQSEWVLSWSANAPQGLRGGFDAMAKDAIRSYMVDPDRFEQLEFDAAEFDARFALFAALLLRPVYCPESCGEIVLYAAQVWALVHDDMRPNSMFVCTTQMPFSGSTAARGECYAHRSILTLVAQHDIEPGQFVTVMSRNPFAFSGGFGDSHPARIWPLKKWKGMPYTSHDDLAEFETGPMSASKKKRLEVALVESRLKTMAPYWTAEMQDRDTLGHSLTMLKLLRKENEGFNGGPSPHPFWTMVLPRSVVVLLYSITELARDKNATMESRREIAAAFNEMDYAKCLQSMQWPLTLLDLYLHCQGHDHHYETKVFGTLQARARELCADSLGCDPDELIHRINGALPPLYHVGPPPAQSCIRVSAMSLKIK